MYRAALIVHVAAALLLTCAAVTALVATLRSHTTPTVAGVRRLMSVKKRAGSLIGPAMALLLAAGSYMAARHGDDGTIRWSSGWLDVAIVVFAAMAVLGPAVEARHARRVLRMAAELPDGPVPAGLDTLRRAPLPALVGLFGVAQIVVIGDLMTTKPGLVGALLAVLAGACVAGAVGSGHLRRLRTAGAPAPDVVEGTVLPRR